MKNRHESNTYFVVQQQPGKINDVLFLESSCRENFGQMIIFPQLSINFVMTITECRSRFPKSHVGSFQIFSPSHLPVLSTLSPGNMFCATGGCCPHWRQVEKKGLWLILLIEMKWMFRIWRCFFINFFLSTHFKNHGESFSEPPYPI